MTLPSDPGAVFVGLVLEDPRVAEGSFGGAEWAACERCGGTGWASFPDPFLDGDLIDAACPCGAGPAR